MLEMLYRGLTRLSGPAVRLLLRRRLARGKEDAARLGERLGHPGRVRPAGRLVWIHAASVGESLAILPLVERLLAADAALHLLVTTGTVTSATLMAQRLPAPRAFHRYIPVDLPDAVDRFLAHWQPDLVLWIESEFWPNLLRGIRRRAIPAALVNARLSAKSFNQWQRVPATARRLLSPFRLALAQTETEAARLRALGLADVRAIGNLKYSARPLPADAETLAAWRMALGERPVWCFASSHPGEEELAIAAHRQLLATQPTALLILAPRHPARGDAVATLLQGAGLAYGRRSAGAVPEATQAVLLLDTLGELGLAFRLAPVSAIGGSFAGLGGHNPIEPALLGSAVLYGPSMFNFAEMAAALEQADAAWPLPDAAALAPAVAELWSNPARRNRQTAAAQAVAERNAQAVDRVMEALAPLLAVTGIGT